MKTRGRTLIARFLVHDTRGFELVVSAPELAPDATRMLDSFRLLP